MDSTAEDNAKILAEYADPQLTQILQLVLSKKPAVVQALITWALPGRAYGTTRLFSEDRFEGVVKSFNDKTGYGFIECEGAREAFDADVFVHQDQLGAVFGAGVAPQGCPVHFVAMVNKDAKPQAFDVKVFGNVQAVIAAQVAQAAQGGMELQSSNGAGSQAPPRPPRQQTLVSHEEVPGVTDRRFEGILRRFNEEKGFGFIESPELHTIFGNDVFVHHQQLVGLGSTADSRTTGMELIDLSLSFGVFLNKDRKPQAKEVQQLGGPPAPPRQPTSIPVPGITDRRYEGILKSFNAEKGYGFIVCPQLSAQFGGDVFVHQKQLQALGSPVIGQTVEFSVFMSKEQKPQAKTLTVPGGEAEAQAQALAAQVEAAALKELQQAAAAIGEQRGVGGQSAGQQPSSGLRFANDTPLSRGASPEKRSRLV